MDTKLLPSLFPTYLAIIIIIFFITTTPISAGSDAKYTACSTSNYSCGSIQNIGYPFWGGDRPQFCGHPDFHLTCYSGADNSTNIYIPSLGYSQVRNINTSSHKIFASAGNHSNVQGDRLLCQPQDNGKHYVSRIFKFSLGVVNLTLFYGCDNSSVSKYGPKSFGCLTNDHRNGSVMYFSDMSEEVKEANKSCRYNYSVPVPKTELDKLNNGSEKTLLGVLENAVIEVEYVLNFTACLTCQNSGGSCGLSDNSSSSDHFVCYYPDGHQAATSNKLIIIELVTGVSAAGIVLLIVVIICPQRRRSVNKSTFSWTKGKIENQNVIFLEMYGSLAPKRYTYADVKKMTNSFKERLGEGGYGHVYKGKLRNGRSVAVKVLKKLNGKGEDFINEVVSISRTNHVNVVTLLGFCFEGARRALVYEFLPNGSLEKFIHGATNGKPLTCESLLNIAVGIAKGLDYLHRGCNTRILHFDIKPHNILLDERFCPKISDFGLARLFPKEQSHISTFEARGTIGYIAPEVFCRNFGGVSHKSDVYSFGMMVIDMVCGRTNTSAPVQSSSDLYFLQCIYNQLEVEQEQDTTSQGIIDNEQNQLRTKMILVGLWCIQAFPSNRPSMNEVVEMLEGSLESLQMPPKSDMASPSRSVIDSLSTTQSTS